MGVIPPAALNSPFYPSRGSEHLVWESPLRLRAKGHYHIAFRERPAYASTVMWCALSGSFSVRLGSCYRLPL